MYWVEWMRNAYIYLCPEVVLALISFLFFRFFVEISVFFFSRSSRSSCNFSVLLEWFLVVRSLFLSLSCGGRLPGGGARGTSVRATSHRTQYARRAQKCYTNLALSQLLQKVANVAFLDNFRRFSCKKFVRKNGPKLPGAESAVNLAPPCSRIFWRFFSFWAFFSQKYFFLKKLTREKSESAENCSEGSESECGVVCVGSLSLKHFCPFFAYTLHTLRFSTSFYAIWPVQSAKVQKCWFRAFFECKILPRNRLESWLL